VRDGSGRGLPSQWQKLMSLTLEAIDSVSSGDNAPEWTFGGGTSLAIDLGHRISYDIDAFMDSAKLIHALAPNRNEVTRSICWNDATGRPDYQWPGHYLKLFVAGVGEIDFLSSVLLTDNAVVPFEFGGRTISRERPAEVMAKKLHHRGSTFKARDVFDLAGTLSGAAGRVSSRGGRPRCYCGRDRTGEDENQGA
jgi:Nucleotidyl transferase AbiEii toxin, Type IV TA system